MKNLSNKCANCGSELLYDPVSRCLSCIHCGSKIIIDTNESPIKKPYSKNAVDEILNSSQFVCSNCGNHYIDISGQMTRCASCGSSDLKEISSTSIKPDGIVPFSLTKQQAGDIFYAWIRKRHFAPNQLKYLAKTKKLSASYIPVWSFDYNCNMLYRGVGETSSTDSDGNRTYYHHNFNGVLAINRENFFVKANKNVDSKIIRDLGFESVPVRRFNVAYFFGWSSLQNDVNRETACGLFKTESKELDDKFIKEKVRRDHGYERIVKYDSDTIYNFVNYNFVCLPVWTNYYVYKDRMYKCHINGATGNLVGKYPKSWIKILLLVLGIIGAVLSPVLITMLIILLQNI